jgi:hypothetical protein
MDQKGFPQFLLHIPLVLSKTVVATKLPGTGGYVHFQQSTLQEQPTQPLVLSPKTVPDNL